jgi:hypothetical protein
MMFSRVLGRHTLGVVQLVASALLVAHAEDAHAALGEGTSTGAVEGAVGSPEIPNSALR